jgi:hypothetical protein
MLRKFALAFGAIALATAMTVGLVSIPRMVRASGTPTPWTFTEKITVNTSSTAVQNAILGDVQGYLQGIVNSPALAVASPTVTISPSASPYTNQVTASYVITFGAQDLQTAQVTINNITKLLQGLVLNPQISVVVPPAQYAAIAASPNSFAFTSTPAQGLVLSEYLYSGAYTATAAPSAACAGNAVIDSPSPSPAATTGTQGYAVTPVATGTCNVAFKDTNGQQTVIAITVSYGPLVVSNAAVALPSPTAAATTNVSEAFYTGTLVASPAATGCTGVITSPSPASTHGPSDVQHFTGIAAGTCLVTVTDANSKTTTYTVTVP